MSPRKDFLGLTYEQILALWERLGLAQEGLALADAIGDHLKAVAAQAEAFARNMGQVAVPGRRSSAEVREAAAKIAPTTLKDASLSIFAPLFDEGVDNPLAALRKYIGDVGHKVSNQTIQTANRKGATDAYDEAGLKQVFWMCLSDGASCNDCLYLHGAVMNTEEFNARFGSTRCNGNCRCKPMPVGKEFDKVGPIERINEWADDDPWKPWRNDPTFQVTDVPGQELPEVHRVGSEVAKELAK